MARGLGYAKLYSYTYKRGTLECCNKIPPKIIAGRMKSRLDGEIAEEEAGFRPGSGTRDQRETQRTK